MRRSPRRTSSQDRPDAGLFASLWQHASKLIDAKDGLVYTPRLQGIRNVSGTDKLNPDPKCCQSSVTDVCTDRLDPVVLHFLSARIRTPKAQASFLAFIGISIYNYG